MSTKEITTMAGVFKSVKDLITYTDAAYLTIKSANDRIKQLENEVHHLQQLLAETTPLIEDSNVAKIIKSPELVICEAQIQILQNRALQKELTLEEVKTFDLLVKNKKILLGEAPLDGSSKRKPKQVYSDEALIQLAQIEDKPTKGD